MDFSNRMTYTLRHGKKVSHKVLLGAKCEDKFLDRM